MNMTSLEQKRQEYKAPLADYSEVLPDILCDSNLDGGLENLGEEDWTL